MRRTLSILAAIQALSCAAIPPSPAGRGAPVLLSRAEQSRQGTQLGLAPTPARLVAELPRGTVGPYLGVGPAGRIAVWAEPSREGYGWYAAPLRRGTDPMPLGSFGERPDVVTVRRSGPARAGSGFIVAASFASERSIVVFSVEESGRIRTKPVKLPTRGERVVWIDAVAHPSGTMILWAAAEGDAALVEGIEARAGGVLDPVPKVIARDVLAWQTAGLADGAALGIVVDKGSGARSVEVIAVDDDGEVTGKPWVVREGVGLGLDLDMVLSGGQLLLAWAERSDLGTRIFRARVDAQAGSVSAPQPLAPSNRAQTLVGLVTPAPGQSHGFVVWEEATPHGQSPRALIVARLDANGEASVERAAVDYVGEGTPEVEFSASSRGLGILTRAPVCPTQGACGNEVSFTFVELDDNLKTVTSEPVTIDDSGRVADLVWGLSCVEGRRCRSLATVADESAAVFDLSLGARGFGTRPAARGSDEPMDEVPAESTPVVRAHSIADFDVARMGSRRLVAWVTDFNANDTRETPTEPAPDGKSEPVRALLDVVGIEGMHPSFEPVRVSWRARSVSGLDLAADADRALLVWSALDRGRPEVFLTLLDAQGRKLRQRMFTHQRSEIYDVAAARVDDGWIVAWIDARNADPEVYAARVTEGLDLVAPGRRLTRAKGTASDLELLSLGSSVLAVWSDDRADATRGSGNLHGVFLRASDALPLRPESCLFAGEEHDHSPALALDAAGIHIAWIEQRTAATPSEAWIRTGTLDRSGRFTAEPSRSVGIPGNPVDLAVDCDERSGCTVAWAQTVASGTSVFASAVDDQDRLGDAKLLGSSSTGLRETLGLALDSGLLLLDDADSDGRRLDVLELRQ